MQLSIVEPCYVDCTSIHSYITLQSNVFYCQAIARVAHKHIIWIAINEHSGGFCVNIQYSNWLAKHTHMAASCVVVYQVHNGSVVKEW